MAVTLHSSALHANIEQSIRDYIQTSLVTGAGLSVIHQNAVEPPTYPRWVTWSSALLSVAIDSSGTLDGTYDGAITRGWLELTVIERVASRTSHYTLGDMRDKVRRYFTPRTPIPIRNYDVAGDPIVGTLHLGITTSRQIDSGQTSGFAEWSITVPVMRVDMWTQT